MGSSASNGVAERGVQTVEEQIRVLKDAFETQVGAQIPSNHNILAWLVEFAGTVVNRYEVGRDGKTPFERLHGKQSRLIGLEFGEKVNLRPQWVSGWTNWIVSGVTGCSWCIAPSAAKSLLEHRDACSRRERFKGYEHHWHKQNMDMVGIAVEGFGQCRWRGGNKCQQSTSAWKCQRLTIPGLRKKMRAQSFGNSTSELKISRGMAPQRIARSERRVPHSDTYRKLLTEEIEKSDEGARDKRARQRELEFYERVILESDHQAKRTFPAANEENDPKSEGR